MKRNTKQIEVVLLCLPDRIVSCKRINTHLNKQQASMLGDYMDALRASGKRLRNGKLVASGNMAIKYLLEQIGGLHD